MFCATFIRSSHFGLLFVVLFNGAVALEYTDDLGSEEEEGCRLYFAPSTIPGAGMGIFAGIDFDIDDVVMYGDIAVPIDELPFHSGSTEYEFSDEQCFIWGDYSWDTGIAGNINFDYEGAGNQPLKGVEMASMGIGAMPNCKFGFVNLYSKLTLADTADLDRKSPGNGAFTPYHERVGYAKEPLAAGSELFEDYGAAYFNNRPDSLGHVPHEEDYDMANEIISKLGEIRNRLAESSRNVSLLVLQDAYEIAKDAWSSSRVLHALPDPKNNHLISSSESGASGNVTSFFDTIIQKGSKYLEKKRSMHKPEWLKENGICMDGIHSGISTIPHAGRGAFATRHFRKGDVIAPIPLIHMPEKDILAMFAAKQPEENEEDELDDEHDNHDYDYSLPERDAAKPIGKQLFLNYCFGHSNSTMLLAPYGSISSLVNHGSGKSGTANARMEWADWQRHPEWLEETPEALLEYHYAGLGWNLIATRDIEMGEEVLFDYGERWEAAWEKHQEEWNAKPHIPTGTSVPYVPAKELNENIEQVLLGAVDKKLNYALMGHGVTLYCYYTARFSHGDDEEDGDDEEAESSTNDGSSMQECRPVAVSKGPHGESLFVVEILEWVENDSDWELVVRDTLFAVSAAIFQFYDIPYNTAFKMPWSFRHEMAIPDEIFPEAWNNL